MRERDESERESPSGAMRGSGRGAGSPDMPFPRTDAADTGRGDGGLDEARDRAAARWAQERGSDVPDLDEVVRRDHDARGDRDPAPGEPMRSAEGGVTRRDDGARGADREHGGWGDEGIGGGRAGGTGI